MFKKVQSSNNKKVNMGSSWNSGLGFIMATVGAAVGLGNLWKFPYTLGENGGAVFLFLFLFFVFLVGLPLLLSEMSIGLLSKKDATHGLEDLSTKYGGSSYWKYFGLLGNVTLILIMSFYSIISGWCFVYLYHSFAGSFMGATPEVAKNIWNASVGNPAVSIFAHGLFVFITGFIVSKGVSSGLEKYSKIMMPALFVLMFVVVIYNYFNFGIKDSFDYLFKLDLSKLNTKVLISAVGQAFFSLAVGAGAMCVYASYKKDTKNFMGQIYIVIGANILVAILAGFVIFPAVLFYGMAPDAGPSLIFQTLPVILGKMQFGNIIGATLFTLFIFAALTSSISLIEPPVAYICNTFNISRQKAVVLVSLIPFILGSIYILDQSMTVFGFVADLSSELMLSIGALSFSLFVGWVLPRNKVEAIVHNSLYYNIIRWLLPLVMSIIIALKLVHLFGLF